MSLDCNLGKYCRLKITVPEKLALDRWRNSGGMLRAASLGDELLSLHPTAIAFPTVVQIQICTNVRNLTKLFRQNFQIDRWSYEKIVVARNEPLIITEELYNWIAGNTSVIHLRRLIVQGR